jgi:hypothetical protein
MRSKKEPGFGNLPKHQLIRLGAVEAKIIAVAVKTV